VSQSTVILYRYCTVFLLAILSTHSRWQHVDPTVQCVVCVLCRSLPLVELSCELLRTETASIDKSGYLTHSHSSRFAKSVQQEFLLRLWDCASSQSYRTTCAVLQYLPIITQSIYYGWVGIGLAAIWHQIKRGSPGQQHRGCCSIIIIIIIIVMLLICSNIPVFWLAHFQRQWVDCCALMCY